MRIRMVRIKEFTWILAGLAFPLWTLPELRLPLSTFALDVGLISLFIVFSFRLLSLRNHRVQLKGYEYIALALPWIFFIWLCMGLLWGNPEWGTPTVVKLLVSLIVYSGLIAAQPSKHAMTLFIRSAIVSGALVVCLLMWRYLIDFRAPYVGIYFSFATASGRNQLGVLLSILQPISLGYALYNRKMTRWLPNIAFSIATVLLGSRSTWIASSLGCMFILWTFFRVRANSRNGRFLVYLAASFGTVYFAVLRFTEVTLYQRHRLFALFTTETVAGGSSVQTRGTLIELAIAAFSRHPVTGIGTGAFAGDFVGTFLNTEILSHNDYAAIMAELGLIGISLFMGFVFYVVYIQYLSRRVVQFQNDDAWIHLGLSGGTIALLIRSFFVNQYDVYPFWVLLAMLVCSFSWVSHSIQTRYHHS